MKKIILKFKMRQVIVFMSILSIVFTCIIAGIGITTSRKINDNVQWIYNYYGWGNLVDNMILNLKDMQINRLEAIKEYSNESLNKLEKLNDEFITNYYEYNDPEDGEQGEKETEFLNNTYVAYEEYYQVNLDIINQIKNSEKVDNNLVNRSVELEKIMMDNLNGLEEYLVSWAELDKNDSDDMYSRVIIRSIFIVSTCIIVFLLISVYIVKVFRSQMKEITLVLSELAEGNLDIDLKIENNNEFDEMKVFINETVNKFNQIVKGVKEKSSDLDERAEVLSIISEELSSSVASVFDAVKNVTNGSEEQASDMIEVTESLNKFSNTVEEFVVNLHYLNNNSKEISNTANTSSDKMDQLLSGFKYIEISIRDFINKIGKLSITINEVSNITNLINSIAEQTNLLALNAAIESARVGEAGKGFAVVAEEIRVLAEQSKESANSITTLINDVSNDTNIIVNESNTISEKLKDSSKVIDDSLNSFAEIIKAIEEIVPKINELNIAADSINKETATIGSKIENSAAIAQEISASTEEIESSLDEINTGSHKVASTSNNLSELTNILQKEVEVFKTK